MKKILLVILFLLVFLQIGNATEVEFIQIPMNEPEIVQFNKNFYIDTSTIIRKGNLVTFWYINKDKNFLNTLEAKSYAQDVSNTPDRIEIKAKIDCNTRELSLFGDYLYRLFSLKYWIYNINDNLIFTSKNFPQEHHVLNSSNNLYNIACSIKSPNWEIISSNQNEKIYLDKNSIKTNNNNVSGEFKHEILQKPLNTTIPSGTYQYVSRNRAYCGKNMFSSIYTVYYDLNDKIISSLDFKETRHDTPEFFQKFSQAEQYYNALCSIKR